MQPNRPDAGPLRILIVSRFPYALTFTDRLSVNLFSVPDAIKAPHGFSNPDGVFGRRLLQ